MEAKITSRRTLRIYPANHNEEQKTAEIIFIEDILGLKKDGDSILLIRKDLATGLNSLAYLEAGLYSVNDRGDTYKTGYFVTNEKER